MGSSVADIIEIESKETKMSKGILYGVSTGPGDPELMTVKAMKAIEKCEVIAAPRTKGENCMALDIVKGIMNVDDKEIIYLDFAMKKDAGILNSTHRQQADVVEEALSQGKNVAMLNIGDASLFGTYCYVRDLVVADGYESITIPGVTSFCASAAVLEQSLTVMHAPMTIIPGSFDGVEEALNYPGTKVIMKSASALPQVRDLLEEKGWVDKASFVANCGLPTQKVVKDIRESKGDEGYFVTILVQE